VRVDHTATLLPSGKVLVAGGATIGEIGKATPTNTAELFDPVTGTFTPLSQNTLPVTMVSARADYQATLLLNGQVLLTGGLSTSETGSVLNDPVNTAELFDPNLGFFDARRPVLSSVSGLASQPSSLTASGRGFRGDSEASGSGTGGSPTNYPLLQLTRIDNGQTFFPLATGWSDTTFESEVLGTPAPLPTGYYRVTIFTNGIPSLQNIVSIATASPVRLTSAVSRKTHGSAGNFDVDLTNGSGIECRNGGANGDYTLVLTFANPLASVGGASVSSGTGTAATANIDTTDAHRYIVNLTGVTNAQRITVSLTNVSDSTGNFSANVPITMGVLVGDVNGSRRVDSSDVTLVRQQALQTITPANFREDIDASGRIDSEDVTTARQQALTSLP
jgi:hypothetical protein